MTESRSLQAKVKQQVPGPFDKNRRELVFTPQVDIYETDDKITLLADMPGVAASDVDIDLKEGVLTLSGDVKPPEETEESSVLMEFEVGKYYRQFTLSDVIDQTNISAEQKNGVLCLTLPKVQKAAPRRITVAAG